MQSGPIPPDVVMRNNVDKDSTSMKIHGSIVINQITQRKDNQIEAKGLMRCNDITEHFVLF